MASPARNVIVLSDSEQVDMPTVRKGVGSPPAASGNPSTVSLRFPLRFDLLQLYYVTNMLILFFKGLRNCGTKSQRRCSRFQAPRPIPSPLRATAKTQRSQGDS